MVLLTLETIAETNENILLDTNVITGFLEVDRHRIYLFDEQDTLGLSRKLDVLRNTMNFLKRYENKIFVTDNIYKEVARILRYAKKSKKKGKNEVKRVESFARNSSFSRQAIDQYSSYHKLLSEIVESCKSLSLLLGARKIKTNSDLRDPLFELVMNVAKNINLFYHNPHFNLDYQKDSITDEDIVAQAFAFSLSRLGPMSIITNDKRIPALAESSYAIMNYLANKPESYHILYSLEDFPVRVYLGNKKDNYFEEIKFNAHRTFDGNRESEYFKFFVSSFPLFMRILDNSPKIA